MSASAVITVSVRERKVLSVLANIFDPHEWQALSFKGIAKRCDVEPRLIRRVTRSLARKGLAQYERSLWSDDGMPAGAGYRCTQAGVDWLTDHYSGSDAPDARVKPEHGAGASS